MIDHDKAREAQRLAEIDQQSVRLTATKGIDMTMPLLKIRPFQSGRYQASLDDVPLESVISKITLSALEPAVAEIEGPNELVVDLDCELPASVTGDPEWLEALGRKLIKRAKELRKA